MNRNRVLLIVVVVVGLLNVAGAMIGPRQAVAQNATAGSAPVNIVSPVPLPVMGTLGISGTAQVNVTNPASTPVLVRDVDGLREPFQVSGAGGFSSPDFAGTPLVTVPAGKRLVIEHVSASINVGNTQVSQPLANVVIGIISSNTFDNLVCTAMGSDANNRDFSCNTQTKFYAEPGQLVSFIVRTVSGAPGNNGGGFAAFASGYYVRIQ